MPFSLSGVYLVEPVVSSLQAAGGRQGEQVRPAEPELAQPAREGGGCAEGRVCRAGDDRG